MTIDSAAKTVWNYMLMNHELKKADLILALGNRDTSVAEYAADLFLHGWAPLLMVSGSGSVHHGKPGREKFAGTTEAEVFADIAIKKGIPKEAIIIENKSQSTGDNFEFSIKELGKRGINPKRVIIVQKPYMQRRIYATGKVHWPDVDLIAASAPVSFEDYLASRTVTKEYTLNAMVGDLQRIIEYPKRGFQIEQDVPEGVLQAYEFLVKNGFTQRLIK